MTKEAPSPEMLGVMRDTSAGRRWEKPLKLRPLSPPSRLWPGCQVAGRVNGPEGRGKHNSALWQPTAFSSGQSSLHFTLKYTPRNKIQIQLGGSSKEFRALLITGVCHKREGAS